ncbi:MAG TPA: flagellar hook-basal body complex protein [Candidatus Saccharimonadales bacterium]|nr:flagellar hook-basal body complex protein [Candidatus Saccharimonadales bacterium]
MISSLSSGVSGLESYQQEMDLIGSNIANVNTTGFKAGTIDFADSFSNLLQGGSNTTPAVQVGTGVGIDAVNSNWAQGTISSGADMTQSDLAISGNGFFQVKDASGNVFATRDGTFQVDTSGNLITANGDFVQGLNAAGTAGNVQITITGSPSTSPMTSFTINSAGQVTVNQADGTTFVSGQLQLQSYSAPQMLVNEGDNLYSNLAAAGPSTAAAPGTTGLGNIQSGALESSNVDLPTEMANLITAQRAFEANSKIITTSNEVLQTVVNMKQG